MRHQDPTLGPRRTLARHEQELRFIAALAAAATDDRRALGPANIDGTGRFLAPGVADMHVQYVSLALLRAVGGSFTSSQRRPKPMHHES